MKMGSKCVVQFRNNIQLWYERMLQKATYSHVFLFQNLYGYGRLATNSTHFSHSCFQFQLEFGDHLVLVWGDICARTDVTSPKTGYEFSMQLMRVLTASKPTCSQKCRSSTNRNTHPAILILNYVSQDCPHSHGQEQQKGQLCIVRHLVCAITR